MQFFANIFVRTVLTDLPLSCVYYTIFSVVKSDLFIRALLLDRILITDKNYEHAPRTSCYTRNSDY